MAETLSLFLGKKESIVIITKGLVFHKDGSHLPCSTSCTVYIRTTPRGATYIPNLVNLIDLAKPLINLSDDLTIDTTFLDIVL